MKKIGKVALAIAAVFLLVIFLPSIIGTLTFGISWGMTSREAEKEIQQYIESIDTEFLISQSLPLMKEAAQKNIAFPNAKKTYVITAESIPTEWKQRNVMFIYYTEEYVDYVWTGGVLGRRAIMVRKGSSGFIIEACIRPDDPLLSIYPPKT